MKSMMEIVRFFRKQVDNGRTQQSIASHMRGELDELDIEIELVEQGNEPGVDGIVGENIDIIACALDSILMAAPDITDDQLMEILAAKCLKWVRVYG